MKRKLLLPLIQDSCELKIIKDKACEVKSESGMTLIELILVMVLISILAGFISKIIYYEINTYEMIADRKDELQSSRYAFHVMTRDIRQIMRPDSISHASADSISFDDVDNFTISYKYQNNHILRNGDLLVDGASRRPIAFSLSSSNFFSCFSCSASISFSECSGVFFSFAML